MKTETEVARPSSDLSTATLKHALREMLRVRRVEERLAKLYREGKFGGFCHLVIGQEAVAVAAAMAKRADDDILTTYRDHGLALACGMSAFQMIAELLGRVDGSSQGRGGSMHLFDAKNHMHGGHGIVGAHIPLSAGIAFANKYKGNGAVSIAMLGDGAVPNGAFHEALNLAGLWRLPFIALIENNQFAMGTPLSRSNAIVDMYKRAEGYNMEGLVCDGMDFFDVYRTIKKACDLARQFKPVLLEVRTQRYVGHSMSDPVHGHYRTKEEVERAKLLDPITRLSEHLMEAGEMTEAEYKAMDKEVQEEMKQATEDALASPPPSTDDVYKFIYANPEGMVPPGVSA